MPESFLQWVYLLGILVAGILGFVVKLLWSRERTQNIDTLVKMKDAKADLFKEQMLAAKEELNATRAQGSGADVGEAAKRLDEIAGKIEVELEQRVTLAELTTNVNADLSDLKQAIADLHVSAMQPATAGSPTTSPSPADRLLITARLEDYGGPGLLDSSGGPLVFPPCPEGSILTGSLFLPRWAHKSTFGYNIRFDDRGYSMSNLFRLDGMVDNAYAEMSGAGPIERSALLITGAGLQDNGYIATFVLKAIRDIPTSTVLRLDNLACTIADENFNMLVMDVSRCLIVFSPGARPVSGSEASE